MKSARSYRSRRGTRRPRRRARGSARRRRTCRRRRPPCRRPVHAGDQLADAAEAEDAERLAVELAPPNSALPAARDQRAVGLGHVAHSASSIAIVCSAAAIEFDSGALATMMPRRVAASMSTLSTPVPARPITFSRSARPRSRRRSAWSPSGSGSRRSRRSLSSSSSAMSSRGRRRSSAQELDAGVGDLLLDQDPKAVGHGRSTDGLRRAGLGEDLLRGPGAGTRLDVVAELVQGHLEPAEGDEDVEGAVVAAMGDADDLALQVSLAAGDR